MITHSAATLLDTPLQLFYFYEAYNVKIMLTLL